MLKPHFLQGQVLIPSVSSFFIRIVSALAPYLYDYGLGHVSRLLLEGYELSSQEPDVRVRFSPIDASFYPYAIPRPVVHHSIDDRLFRERGSLFPPFLSS